MPTRGTSGKIAAISIAKCGTVRRTGGICAQTGRIGGPIGGICVPTGKTGAPTAGTSA